MSIISFNWDKHFLYAIIYWVLEICIRLVMYERWDLFSMSNSDVQNEYIYVVLLTISDLFAAFLVLYIKCSFKKEQNKFKKADTDVELIYDSSANEINKSKNLIIRMVIVSASTYFSRSLYWISYGITGAENNKVSHQLQKDVVNTLDIIMRYIFSVFILKVIVYKHRIFSMVTINIGLVILIINDIILMSLDTSMKYDIGKTLFFTTIASISGFTYPLEDTF